MDTSQGNNPDRLMTTEEVAAYLGYAVQTIYNKVRAKELPVRRIGGRSLRFRVSEIDRWVEEQSTAAENQDAAA